MKDDVKNTAYVSHYNQEHGKVPEVNYFDKTLGAIDY
jgi:hypothetical protein